MRFNDVGFTGPRLHLVRDEEYEAKLRAEALDPDFCDLDHEMQRDFQGLQEGAYKIWCTSWEEEEDSLERE